MLCCLSEFVVLVVVVQFLHGSNVCLCLQFTATKIHGVIQGNAMTPFLGWAKKLFVNSIYPAFLLEHPVMIYK